MKYLINKFAKIETENNYYYIYPMLTNIVIKLVEDRFINEFKSILDKKGTDNIESQLEKVLYDYNVLISNDIDFYSYLLRKVDEINSSEFDLTIMPTEKCNFRCVYCYEKFPNTVLNCQDYDILFNHIKYKIDKEAVSNICISWYGGEPLLAFNDIIGFNQRIKSLAEESNVLYSSGITTNGYLLNYEKAVKLVESGVKSVAITLDGYEHDKQRILIDGTGSFNIILKNIKSILRNEISLTIIIRVNIANKNFNYDFYDEFKEFKNDERLKFCIRPVMQWGEECVDINLLTDKESISNIKTHWDYIKKIGLGNLDIEMPEYSLSLVCSASKKTHW